MTGCAVRPTAPARLCGAGCVPSGAIHSARQAKRHSAASAPTTAIAALTPSATFSLPSGKPSGDQATPILEITRPQGETFPGVLLPQNLYPPQPKETPEK